MAAARHWEQDKDSTIYVGNIDERCTDAVIWELMVQCGPVVNVHLPKDRVTQTHQGYGFVEFAGEQDADYAVKLMNQVRLYTKPIRVNKASADKRSNENGAAGGGQGIGAELFVGNLDSLVDERVLYETFSRFGPILAVPKIARTEDNLSKGFGFVSYASFESSDQAIENLNGQYLMNKEITVQYAYKKDGKGERHGDEAERALAAQAKKHGVAVNIPAMPASLIMNNTAPTPATPTNGFAPPTRPAQPPPGFPPAGFPGYPPQPGFPPPQAFPPSMPVPIATGTIPSASPIGAGVGIPPNLPQQPQRGYNQSPLPVAPTGAGLPARPPPSNAGYGGPPLAPGGQPPLMGAPGAPPGSLPPGAYPPGYRPMPNGLPQAPPPR